jgi:hypothetical protein
MNQSEKTLAKTLLTKDQRKWLADDDLALAEKQMIRLFNNINIMDICFDDVLTILEEIAKLKDGTLELKVQNYKLTKINGHWKSYPRKTK